MARKEERAQRKAVGAVNSKLSYGVTSCDPYHVVHRFFFIHAFPFAKSPPKRQDRRREMEKRWDVSFLSTSAQHGDDKWALVVLNQPFPASLFKKLWQATFWRAFADGGANRAFNVLGDERGHYIPDLIKGDLDSIRDYSRNYYGSNGVRIVRDEDQDSTDLMKCIQEVVELEQNLRAEGTISLDVQVGIIILGGLTGRLDHTVHTLSLLHKLRNQSRKIMVVSEDNVAWVLDSGTHHITLDESVLGPNCGLLPLGIDSTILTTQGLRWNLTDTESSFEGLVSTSNAIVGPIVQIKTTRPIWWSIEFRKGFLT